MALTIEQVGSAAVFAETVEPFLAADPLLNTQAVGWLDAVLGRERRLTEAANARLFGLPTAAAAAPDWPPIMQVVRCDDAVVAAAMQGGGTGLTIITVPGVNAQTSRAAMNLIGSELATVGPQITMLSGPSAAVESVNDGLSGAGGQIFDTNLPASLLECGERCECGDQRGGRAINEPIGIAVLVQRFRTGSNGGGQHRRER